MSEQIQIHRQHSRSDYEQMHAEDAAQQAVDDAAVEQAQAVRTQTEAVLAHIALELAA